MTVWNFGPAQPTPSKQLSFNLGQVAEWFKALDSKPYFGLFLWFSQVILPFPHL
jgi:hypothetical protein